MAADSRASACLLHVKSARYGTPSSVKPALGGERQIQCYYVEDTIKSCGLGDEMTQSKLASADQ